LGDEALSVPAAFNTDVALTMASDIWRRVLGMTWGGVKYTADETCGKH